MTLTAGKVTELILKSVAFSMLLGIVGYMFYIIVMWFVAVWMVLQFVFGTMSGSPWID